MPSLTLAFLISLRTSCVNVWLAAYKRTANTASRSLINSSSSAKVIHDEVKQLQLAWAHRILGWRLETVSYRISLQQILLRKNVSIHMDQSRQLTFGKIGLCDTELPVALLAVPDQGRTRQLSLWHNWYLALHRTVDPTILCCCPPGCRQLRNGHPMEKLESDLDSPTRVRRHRWEWSVHCWEYHWWIVRFVLFLISMSIPRMPQSVVVYSSDYLLRVGAVYTAGYFRMSTWIPFVWALINTLVLILSSFAIQGGL